MNTLTEPVIVTDRLIIRRAGSDDVSLLHTLWTDPRVMTNVGFPHGLRTTTEAILDSILQQDKGAVFDRYLIVEEKASGVALGECFLGLPNENGIAETDVKLLPEAWGHRFGIEIKQALVDYLFTYTDCVVVQATPNIDNTASIRMQEAVGGVCVGEGVSEPPELMQDYATPVHFYIYHVTREVWLKRKSTE